MKKLLKILLIFIFTFFLYNSNVNAGVELTDPSGKITESSMGTNTFTKSGKDLVGNIEGVGFSLLTTVKVIFEGVLIIYIVYIGVQMILSMGTNEDELSKSKRSIRYSLIGLVFINIPGTLYNAFVQDNYGTIDGRVGYNSWVNTPGDHSGNILINTFNFGQTLNGDIIGFIEVAISAFAILMIVIAGIKIITSRGKEEEVTKAKDKILWSLVGLVFIGFIEAWKELVFSGDIDDGGNFFETASNLALFFVGPIGIFFLTLAAYYYITANGDEEKAKKAKSIVVNTLIATVLLLASYTFLLDLANL